MVQKIQNLISLFKRLSIRKNSKKQNRKEANLPISQISSINFLKVHVTRLSHNFYWIKMK